MNKLEEYLEHMHSIVKQEVTQADSKIGWRITFIGTIITLFSVLIGIGINYIYIIPFLIYFFLELMILIVFGLWPRYNVDKNNLRKNNKDSLLLSIYSFLFFVNNNEQSIVDELKRKFNKELSELNKEILDQIIVNSVIANKKYKAFKNSFIIFASFLLFKKIFKRG